MIMTGQRLVLADGAWRVAERIGEGGQGVVWRLVAEEGDRPDRALKWYEPASATVSQRESLARLIRRGAPSPAFLWPEELVDESGPVHESGLVDAAGPDHTFGYVMPLRASTYRSISDLLLGRFPAPPSLVLRICVELAHAFLALHTQGLCYRDISFGNVAVDPATGAVLVCDSDNVGVDGASRATVLGTRRFMAPEVVRREAEPSAQTDLYSLAVLVFYLLMLHHPLLGRRDREHPGRDGETYLLGTAPLFVFDPADASNRPDPERQPGPIARWALVPGPIRALFEQSFTVGLHDPAQRVRESVWRATLNRARDRLRTCPRCGTQLPLEAAGVACPGCQRRWDPPIVLRSGHDSIVINADTVISRHHAHHDYDLATAIGRTVFDRDRQRWGIRNVSDEVWIARSRTGPQQRIEPGRTVGLVAGLSLRIGPRELRLDEHHGIPSAPSA